MRIIIAVVLAALFLICILMDQAYRALPIKELRRRARHGHSPEAKAIYKMASFGKSVEALLWIIGTISVAALFLMAASQSGWLAILLVVLASWIMATSSPLEKLDGALGKLAAKLSPLFVILLSYGQPLLGRLVMRRRPKNHAKIYEKDDLVELLRAQSNYTDTRLKNEELELAAGALSFAAKPVSEIMLPASEIKYVSAGSAVGPLLMDELHKSGASYFPVTKTASSDKPEVIGTLYLRDVVNHKDLGTVREVMHGSIEYINESQNLYEALSAFMKVQTHMFLVVDSFGEIVGMLTLDKVLEQILGKLPQSNFDNYENPEAVAKIEEYQTVVQEAVEEVVDNQVDEEERHPKD